MQQSYQQIRLKRLRTVKRCVIKVGSSLLTQCGQGLDTPFILQLTHQILQLRENGIECILVSSGAVAAGMARLNLSQRPVSLPMLQATAAVGQMGLSQVYEQVFSLNKVPTAQVLLTHDGLRDRERYLNARSTLKTLLDYGVVPVINENDAIANEEIRFGDNDSLSAMVVGLIEADLLVLLTDKNGLYTANPDTDCTARLISCTTAFDTQLDDFAGGSGSKVGTGGMITKVQAARIAARAGADTLILGGKVSNILLRVLTGFTLDETRSNSHEVFDNDQLGSLLLADIAAATAKKQWLAIHLNLKAYLVLDTGAVHALQVCGKSLLAVGIKAVGGQFSRGEVVTCKDEQGKSIANGIVNYTSEEIARLKGRSSQEIAGILGYTGEPEMINRHNMVVI